MMLKQELNPVTLLALLTVFFALLLVGVDWLFKGEAPVFQVIAAGFNGSIGALLLAIKQKTQPGDGPTPPAKQGDVNA